MQHSIESLATAIDQAIDNQDLDQLNSFVSLCQSEIEGIPDAIRYFFQANCFNALGQAKHKNNEDRLSWQQDESVQEVLALRRAIAHPSFIEVNDIWKCKIYTNLGNCLNFLGRICEAIRQWDHALEIIPNFAMALGNRAQCLLSYGGCLYDKGHSNILAFEAAKSFKKAIQQKALWDSGDQPELRRAFNESLNSIEQYLKEVQYNENFDFDQWALGRNKEETDYRRWVLSEGLFLSPLNDAIELSVAAQDILHLPNHRYDIDEEARFPNYFNIMKQEYVSARFMFYQSENDFDESHFSDKDVLLMDGFDYANFGYRKEQLKSAYRLCYSVFDKIALFINDYFKVNLAIRGVYFKTIWGKIVDEKFELYPVYAKSQNWPLRGLYFLSKDFFNDEFQDTSLPDAQNLSIIRNIIEHRYLSISEFGTTSVKNSDIHAHITIDDLRHKTLRLLRNAREGLIYLSLAMHREEKLRAEKKSNKMTVPISGIQIRRD